MNEQKDSLSNEKENIKKTKIKSLELKNAIIKIYNSLGILNSWMGMTEARFGELKDRLIESSHLSNREKKVWKPERS